MYEAEEISQTRQEFSLVCQTDIVFADPGDDVVLACRLEPAISAAAMEIKWLNKADLVCHYKDGQVTESRGYEGRVSLSLQDLQRGNVSLTLRDIRGLQRGLYICEVIHEWQTKREYVFLYISSENVRLVVPTDIISADAGADVTLPVHLSPETSAVSMTVMWFRGTELIYQYNNGQGTTNRCCENRVGLPIQELGRGNLSLNLRNVQQSDSGNYTCKVFQDGYLFTGLVHLRVREIDKSDYTRHLQDILTQVYNDTVQQKLTKENIKKLVKALSLLFHGRNKKKNTFVVLEPTSRRTDSMERIPPFLGDGSSVESLEIEDTSVVGPTSRRTNSMEGIPPLMERESGNQNTRQTRERGIATEQARSFPAMPSVQRTSARENTLTQERPEATMQWTLPERRQGSIATAQETSTPAMPSQDPQREGTAGSAMSPAGGRTQAQERPGSSTQRTQRRHESTENKCQIL
ncbi:uncharacterized protein LOC127434436 isoform X1 [Myxocyprinus asiaticus]|uniref:uncharacterized protein LOC127434436 isoform X1 n=1 Tax=Myxocyprinus asiaticus TaxID=70543 RepID=UPI002221DA55|nr:uncharacterized protein LOC127434436 isoform X1 [Myxocyprinus asiaticus]XP_051543153.1 uncharacterized protein LOC127434436 isoform X1 [Myxocyprinus asiaticus]XP_051543154.1 uncharacterized protein LOC127434436 isoform X1 [Myxocyprinus asiaticus]XP_051543155.1 uncharacterized protein LOC127434436 isoform X1 [Myxocyprinus asiaticus]